MLIKLFIINIIIIIAAQWYTNSYARIFMLLYAFVMQTITTLASATQGKVAAVLMNESITQFVSKQFL